MISRTTDGGRHLVGSRSRCAARTLYMQGGRDRCCSRWNHLQRRGRSSSQGPVSTTTACTWASCARTTRGEPGRRPSKLAPIQTAQLFVPDDNFPIRAGDYIPDIAIDPTNGDIYVVWSDGLGGDDQPDRDGEIHRWWTSLERPDGRLPTGGMMAQAYNHIGRGDGGRNPRHHVLRR